MAALRCWQHFSCEKTDCEALGLTEESQCWAITKKDCCMPCANLEDKVANRGLPKEFACEFCGYLQQNSGYSKL